MADTGGITRICEGTSTYISTGDIEYHATEGNLTISAATTNNYSSGEGINHLDYEPLHPDDTLDDEIDITLNIYFDGTLNNKTNTAARENKTDSYKNESNKKDDSYENDYTNIARGYDVMSISDPKQVKVYIEGVGTENEKSDDSISTGLGSGQGTGIKDKAKLGCEKGAEYTKSKLSNSGKKLHTLYVNVYGFSRGAATARYFVDISTKAVQTSNLGSGYFRVFPPVGKPITTTIVNPILTTNGYFGYCLVKNKVYPKKIIFNFVGLYDTVSSYGLYHGNNVSELGLDAVKKANMVFQIASDDEYRENFDLTNINSAGIKGLQLKLPGVHSDIGGSYRENAKEVSAVYKETYTEKSPNEPYLNNVEKFKKILVNEGWFKEDELKVVFEGSNTVLVGTRILQNTYDKIPLNKMILVSKQFDVKYDSDKTKAITNISDPFIAKIFNQLTAYSKACIEYRNEYIKTIEQNNDADGKKYATKATEINYTNYITHNDLKQLRNQYLHWSVKANKFGLSPRFSGVLPIEKRKREEHNG